MGSSRLSNRGCICCHRRNDGDGGPDHTSRDSAHSAEPVASSSADGAALAAFKSSIKHSIATVTASPSSLSGARSTTSTGTCARAKAGTRADSSEALHVTGLATNTTTRARGVRFAVSCEATIKRHPLHGVFEERRGNAADPLACMPAAKAHLLHGLTRHDTAAKATQR